MYKRKLFVFNESSTFYTEKPSTLDAENKFTRQRTYDLRCKRYLNYRCSFSFENRISIFVIVEWKRLRFAMHNRFWCS